MIKGSIYQGILYVQTATNNNSATTMWSV